MATPPFLAHQHGMFRILAFLTLSLIAAALPVQSAEKRTANPTIKAPNLQATALNQQSAYGNGCGPTSLLNAFQFGSRKWQKIFKSTPGNNSRTRINFVVKKWGNKPSNHLKNTLRWNPNAGVTLIDLTDMANEMRNSIFQPKIKYKVLSTKQESSAALIRSTHSNIAKSLKKGLPPILSVHRYAYRFNQQVGQKSWWPIQAHFIVAIEIPKKLPKNATSFHLRYIDPYGGVIRDGIIQTDTGKFTRCPFLGAKLPKTDIGKSLLKSGEASMLALTGIIGVW